MARPYWSGQIQISLVSFGVKLFVATEAKSDIHFHQIDRSTGERVRHQKVLASALERNPDEAAEQSEVVGKSDIVKGYEYAKGQYITLEPDELAHLRVPSKHTMEVTQFVDESDLSPEFFEKPYFAVPEDEAQTEAFLTVRKALIETKKLVVAIAPAGTDQHGGMMVYTMRYAAELRDPAAYFSHVKKTAIQPDSLALAKELIKRKSGKFDAAKFVDGYEVAVKELVDAKLKHAPIPHDEAPASKRGKVVNLMDALRKSVQSKSFASEDSGTSPKKTGTRKGPVLVKSSAPKPSRAAKATHTRRKSA